MSVNFESKYIQAIFYTYIELRELFHTLHL